MSSNINNWEFCRLCTTETSPATRVDIFKEDGREINLLSKISYCLPVIVTKSDELPKFVCNECVKTLEKFHKFREMSLKSESFFLQNNSNSEFIAMEIKEEYLSPDIIITDGPSFEGSFVADSSSVLENQDNQSGKQATYLGNVPNVAEIDVNLRQALSDKIVPGQSLLLGNYFQHTHEQTSSQPNPSVCVPAPRPQTRQSRSAWRNNLMVAPTHTKTKIPPAKQQSLLKLSSILKPGNSTSALTSSANTEVKLSTNVDSEIVTEHSNTINQPSEETKLDHTQLKDQSSSANTDDTTSVGNYSLLAKHSPSKININASTPTVTKPLLYFKSSGRNQTTKQKQIQFVSTHKGKKKKLTSTAASRKLMGRSMGASNSRNTETPPTISQAQKQSLLNFLSTINPGKANSSSTSAVSTSVMDDVRLINQFLAIQNQEQSGEVTINETKHKCQECGKEFALKRHLKSHELIHSTGKHPYCCNCCQKIFANKGSLKRHMKRHDNCPDHVCSYCGKTFYVKHNLIYHVRKFHTNEFPFPCTRCERKFVRKRDLEDHLNRKHTTEPRQYYKCEICNKNYLSKGYLKSHMQIHVESRLKFKCHICDKSLVTKKSLKNHMFTHTQERSFECEICKKSVKTKDGLQIHLLIHSGVKKFVCEFCGKAFALKNVLKTHRHTHTGERPFHCNICDKKFTQKSSLNTHRKCMHPDRDK